MHQISRNNGNDFQTGKNSDNHTMKTTLTSNTYFLVFKEIPFLFSLISINIFYLLNITNWYRTLHYCLSGCLHVIEIIEYIKFRS